MSSDRAISPVSATLASDYSFSKDVVKKLDHVLIAVDGSHASDLAFSWALSKLIDPARHVIYLLSVARINPQASMMYSAGLGGGIPWTILEDMTKECLEEAKKTVLHYHHQVRDKFKKSIQVHSLIGQGDPRDEIVDAVDRVHADLLVLGNRGIGALKRTFLGSTGDYCLHHANCPVMIIKEPKST